MRNPGRMIEHEDGRKGIIYNSEQIKAINDDGKVVVRFYEGDRLGSKKYSVKTEKLKVTGFVD